MKNDAPKVVKIHDVKIDLEYRQWLGEIKARYHNAQIKAAVKVNAEQLLFNWQLGRDLVMRKAEENGVQGLLSRLVWTSRSHSQKYLPTFPGGTMPLDGADETTTLTYGAIAARIAKDKGLKRMSAQAVGSAVGHNSISLIIPCHRVVGTNGSLTGYAGGIDKKVRLLQMEKALSDRLFVPKKGTALRQQP